jgi:hypothetical protein
MFIVKGKSRQKLPCPNKHSTEKISLLTRKLKIELRKKLVMYYIWRASKCGTRGE